VIYRLYEVLVVYGWSYKALIHEKVSNGGLRDEQSSSVYSSGTVSCQLSVSIHRVEGGIVAKPRARFPNVR
jgi:hypothetical protein